MIRRHLTFALLALCAPVAAYSQGAGAPMTGDAPVTAEELRADIAFLADDALEGRKPGTAGETEAVHYIARGLYASGFAGGMPDGGWYQPVPLVELLHTAGEAHFHTADGAEVAAGQLALRAPSGSAELRGVPVIFVGYGVDGAGRVTADVRGKAALVLMEDRPGDDAMSGVDRRAALIAAGAVATITVASARYPYPRLLQSFGARREQLVSALSSAQVEVLISGDGADDLLRAAGLNPEGERAAAEAADYAGRNLSLRVDMTARTARHLYDSYNVVARLPGAVAGSGVVGLMGHWDHLGLCRPVGAEDRICNGAVDNASGIAMLLAVARRIGVGARPDRDILVVATTAEEMGLLGAAYFASHPPVPLASIRVLFNVDTVAVAPSGTPAALLGRGKTPFDAEIEGVVRAAGRVMDEDDDAGIMLKRQDGWELLRAGVPTLMVGGSFSDMDQLMAFLSGPYHEPEDELTDAIELGGAVEDADLHVALVRHFSHVGDDHVAEERPAGE